MAIKRLSELPKDEIEDFESSCAKKGLTSADFDVAVDERYPVGGVGHIHRMASVKKRNAVSGLVFKAGSGRAWIIAFEDALMAGMFDGR